jgi:hypothetical protein
MSSARQHKESQDYDETLQNLRDFLQYLEDKKIINSKYLQNNKEEMSNLISDLMKLDLKKFTSKSKEPTQKFATCRNSPK